MRGFVLCLAMLALLAGCNKPKTDQTSEENAPVVDDGAAFSALLDEARAFYNQGDTDSAANLLTEALANPEFVDNQPTIFRSLLELLLLENRVTDAQTNFLAMLHASPDTAAQTFNMIPAYLMRQEDTGAYLAWSQQMVDMDLPANIKETAYAYYIDANIKAKQLDKLSQLTQESVDRFGAAGAVRVLTRPLYGLVQEQEYTSVNSVLDVMKATGDKAALDFVTTIEIALASDQGQWDTVVTLFTDSGAALPDQSARVAFRMACDQALKANRFDVVDRLCAYVFENINEATETKRQAQTQYIDSAFKAGHYDDVVTRLTQLKADGVSDATLSSKIGNIFYDLMNKASGASKQTLLAMLESMMNEAAPGARAQFQGWLMDGAVLSDDYRLALRMLDDGFRADDPAWRTMARNKLEAHLALKEGRIDDAVSMFRKFMDEVQTWTSNTVDPSTGISYSPAMSLGFNAKRIGDIYRDAGRQDEATKAYAEARAYFDQALKDVNADSKEAAYIKNELAGIPAPAEAK